MSAKGQATHNKKRKYSAVDIKRMEQMLYLDNPKKTLEEVGAVFGVSGRAIENQLKYYGNY